LHHLVGEPGPQRVVVGPQPVRCGLGQMRDDAAPVGDGLDGERAGGFRLPVGDGGRGVGPHGLRVVLERVTGDPGPIGEQVDQPGRSGDGHDVDLDQSGDVDGAGHHRALLGVPAHYAGDFVGHLARTTPARRIRPP
jgi:hypothetical protein